MKKLRLSALTLALLSLLGLQAADYGQPSEIQKGNILQCFNWSMAEVKSNLANIASAGYGAVQLSPLQRADIKSGYAWHDLYRPYDLALKGSSFMGSESDLKALCTEAANYGIKIIVDVVANHVDKTSGYHDTWWDSNGRVRWNGSINYGDRYSITHGQLGDYGDVNSEDSEVQQRAKNFVQKLKDCGVKGIRWDAAKHIGLPSEGCNFWSTVTSVSGMYHYGEILDSPGPNEGIITEYAKYMSFTDNRYSDNAARNNGGIPSSYGGAWAGKSLENKCVYWGESHDTYSNDDGWSKNVSQATIDRAYAAMACRKDAAALYFARPNTSGFNNIKMGKGTDAYKAKHIAEVNKFRNAMVGRDDYFSNNGNACSITRKGGGAVVVSKSSGNVSISNGGGYCPAGTYKDRVSGNTFTVTSSTISGNVGSTGIAVLYNDGTSPTPDPDPDPTPDPDPSPTDGVYCYFNNTSSWDNVYVWAWDSNNGNAQVTSATEWPGEQVTSRDSNGYYIWKGSKGTPTHIIFNNGSGTQTADLSYQNGKVYDANGNVSDYSGGTTPTPDPTPTPTPTDGFTIYYDNSSTNWGTPHIHYWSNPQSQWPGNALTQVSGNIWSYTWSEDPSGLNGFLFCEGVNGGDQTADYTSAPVNGHLYKGQGGKGSVSDEGVYGNVDPTPDPTPDPDPDPTPDPTPVPAGDNLITDYYKVNPNGQVGTFKTISMTGHPATNAMSNWTDKELIAQGVARDVAQAFKGLHERPIVDSYALYAAYDNDNLYLGVQFVYTVWDIGGEGKQPGESKPYNMDGHMFWAFDLDPNKSFDGYINGTGPIWNENYQGAKFQNGVDAVLMCSTKPGVGTPGFFTPTSDGHASYDSAHCKSMPSGFYGYTDGLHPSIDHVWGQPFGSDPSALLGNDGFVDLRSEIDDSAHTFYEFKIPLSTLGITASYIKSQGIGVMYLDKYGTSPVGGTPYDPSYFDNVSGSYSMDPSSSQEKEDEDIITYSPARIGKLASSAVGEMEIEPADAPAEYYTLQGIRVAAPSAAGIYIVRKGNKTSKIMVR